MYDGRAEKIPQAFFLHFCILQGIKNQRCTCRRPENEAPNKCVYQLNKLNLPMLCYTLAITGYEYAHVQIHHDTMIS